MCTTCARVWGEVVCVRVCGELCMGRCVFEHGRVCGVSR